MVLQYREEGWFARGLIELLKSLTTLLLLLKTGTNFIDFRDKFCPRLAQIFHT